MSRPVTAQALEQARDSLEQARASYAGRDWGTARERFLAAAQHAPLSVDDRAALADAAWWLGLSAEAFAGFEDVFRLLIEEERKAEAAKLALDIGFLWRLRGETTVGSGWLRRGRRLLDELPECAEQGYGLAIDVDRAMGAGRFDEALDKARQLQTWAELYGDGTLLALGLVGEGMTLIRQGSVKEGLAVLDEAMLPVAAGEVSPDVVGNIYCQMMGVCHDLADLQRAWEWTESTQSWCDRFSSAVMFLGVCRMHRAQLLQLRGDWSKAEAEAVQVCEDLADLNVVAVGESHYQIGEIRRLRGDLSGAEEAFRAAHQLGRDPQPGRALVSLAQGRTGAAVASLRSSLGSAKDDFSRVRLLHAQVGVALAASEIEMAKAASDELSRIARVYSSPGMSAAAAQAAGAVAAAESRHSEALGLLRDAIRRWSELGVPYEVARCRVLAARSLRSLGDDDAATLELDAASAVFEDLGASIDSKAVAELRSDRTLPGRLTAREAEVLACVAAGQSNREVAATLFISEKTVARHLSNIFTKLGASSRTEAAAFAHEHGLVTHRRA